MRGRYVLLSVLIAAVHFGLLWHAAGRYSAAHDEGPHLAAGLKFWRTGKSDWYVVNPPLVRNIAAAVAVRHDLILDWPDYDTVPRLRPEYLYGHNLLDLNRQHAWAALIDARRVSLIWSVAGLLLCGVVASRAAGPVAGIAAQILWCFCPMMIGHGALIVPDVAAATGLLIGCLGFAHWLRKRNFDAAMVMGATTATALLIKNTLFVLPAVFLVLWLTLRWSGDAKSWQRLWKEAGQVGLAIFLCLFLINLAFGFHGSFVPLGDYEFVSDLLGTADRPSRTTTGNVFSGTPLESIPVPLPMDYVLGFDVQRIDFVDDRLVFYLLGEWSRDGWWHYYLVGLLSKTPVALLVLAAAGGVVTLVRRGPLRSIEFISVAVACVTVFVLVSSQTGLNQHTRYVIPTFPLMFILGGIAVASCRAIWTRVITGALVAMVVAVCLAAYPHCISFFNVATGGSGTADRIMLQTNLDYGQDIAFIADWAAENPQAGPLHLSLYCRRIPPSMYGVDYDSLEISLEPRNGKVLAFESFQAGSYVVSVMNLRWPGSIYDRVLRDRRPDDFIGGAYRVYHLSATEAAELNDRLRQMK